MLKRREAQAELLVGALSAALVALEPVDDGDNDNNDDGNDVGNEVEAICVKIADVVDLTDEIVVGVFTADSRSVVVVPTEGTGSVMETGVDTVALEEC